MTYSLKKLALLAVPDQGIFSLSTRTHGKVNHFQGTEAQEPGCVGFSPLLQGWVWGKWPPTCQVECGQARVGQARIGQGKDVFHLALPQAMAAWTRRA